MKYNIHKTPGGIGLAGLFFVTGACGMILTIATLAMRVGLTMARMLN